MSTTIAAWGNSEAVRIPRETLRAVGLHKGDRVSFSVNERGNIEIVPQRADRVAHRCVAPARGITYETLFAGYDPDASGALAGPAASVASPSSTPAWPNDDLTGAEYQAWAQ